MPLIDKYSHIAITTDLEPDDMLGLLPVLLHAKKTFDSTGSYPIGLIVVGEGHSGIKMKRMEKFIEVARTSNLIPHGVKIDIAQGYGSEKDFLCDGEEYFSKERIQQWRDGGLEATSVDGKKKLVDFLNDHQNPLILQLKPARELLEIAANPETATLVGKADTFIYGSFNIRLLMKTNTKEVLANFLHRFNKTIFFENFYAYNELEDSKGARVKKSLEQANYPTLYNKMMNQKHPIIRDIVKLIDLWNQNTLDGDEKYLLEKFAVKGLGDTLKDEVKKIYQTPYSQENEDRFIQILNDIKYNDAAEKGRYERKLNKWKNIKPNQDFQMVNADTGAMFVAVANSAHYKLEQSRLSYNAKGYTQIDPDKESTLWNVTDVNCEELEKTYVDTINSVIQLIDSKTPQYGYMYSASASREKVGNEEGNQHDARQLDLTH